LCGGDWKSKFVEDPSGSSGTLAKLALSKSSDSFEIVISWNNCAEDNLR